MKATCEKCGSPIAPTVLECSVCGYQFLQSHLVTQEEINENDLQYVRDMAPPDPNALPPDLKLFDIIRFSLIFGILILLATTVLYYDKYKQFSQWIESCEIEFKNRINWTTFPQLPLEGEILVIIAPRGDQFLYDQGKKLIDLLSIQGKIEEKLLSREELYGKKGFNLAEHRTNKNSTLIIVEGSGNIMHTYLGISLWLPVRNNNQSNSSKHFEFRQDRQPFIEFILVLGVVLFLLIFISDKIKQAKIESFRKNQRLEFDKYQETRTESIFKLKEILEESRKLAEEGDIAMALISVNKILRAKPSFKDAIELKKLLLLSENAGSASLSVKEGGLFQYSPTTNTSKVLYLRILGTPYAYQLPSNLDLLTIGRQRRKKNQLVENGNDVVIRVPGSENKSLRISRRHLEIQRINDEYYVIDKSNGQTDLNGRGITMNTPMRIHSGDKLFIAGVFILEVVIRAPIEGKRVENIVQFNSENIEGNLSIEVEATLGDMLTEFPD